MATNKTKNLTAEEEIAQDAANILKKNSSAMNSDISAVNKSYDTEEGILKSNYDLSTNQLQENYDADVADTNESYENAFKKNEVQVKLNERYLQRKAAEMGLTDSGMNRTQMTANQLSYANQKGELTRQRQKAIDTLAATMRAKKAKIDTDYNNSLAELRTDEKNDIAQIKTSYKQAANEQAISNYNTRIQNEQNAIAAQQEEFSSLRSELREMGNTDLQARLLFQYASKYYVDYDSVEWDMLLDAAGMTHNDYMSWYNRNKGTGQDIRDIIPLRTEKQWSLSDMLEKTNKGLTIGSNTTTDKKKKNNNYFNYPAGYVGATHR